MVSHVAKRQRFEKRAKAWAQMTSLVERSERENRDLTTTERRAFDVLEAEITSLTADMERDRRAQAWGDEFGQPVTDRSFEKWARGGLSALTAAEQRSLAAGQDGEARAQGESTTTAGGFLVPSGYWERISETMKAYGGLLGVANVVTTAAGNPLPWPNNDDTANAATIIGENTQVTEVDFTLGQRSLGAWTYSSGVVTVSIELLQDSAFDLEAWIGEKFGQRLGRGVAGHLISGTGTGQPKGILPTVRTGKTGLTGQTTTVIYDDMVDLLHSVDPAYRAAGRCRFVMNDTTLGVIRKLKDSQGHPLWNPSMADGDPDAILGFPVTVDQSMPTMAASTKSVLFGDFVAGMVVRQVLGVQMARFAERYADFLQVGIIGFLRLDAQPDDANATAAYVNSAT